MLLKTFNFKLLIILFSYLIFSGTMLAYGFIATKYIYFPLITIMLFLFFFIGHNNSLVMSLSCLIFTILFSIILKVTGIENSIYYRPHEKLSIYDMDLKRSIYLRNKEIAMMMPHGDLAAISGKSLFDIEPRKVKFFSDSDGFRNKADYNNERYILVGDSFIIGNGNSQENILSSQLESIYNIKTYNIAYPGDMGDYADLIQQFQHKHGNEFKTLLFVFEGNDFPLIISPGKTNNLSDRLARTRIIGDYRNFIRNTNVYRFTFSIYHKALSRLQKKKGKKEIVKVFNINSNKVGFFKEYIDVTVRTNYLGVKSFKQALKSIKDNLCCVFFIPTKYRVYHKFIDDSENLLPDSQWAYLYSLCKEMDISCINLTKPLIKESEKLLKNNIFTYWKDDTHWNKHGISIAAKIASQVITDQILGKTN